MDRVGCANDLVCQNKFWLLSGKSKSGHFKSMFASVHQLSWHADKDGCPTMIREPRDRMMLWTTTKAVKIGPSMACSARGQYQCENSRDVLPRQAWHHVMKDQNLKRWRIIHTVILKGSRLAMQLRIKKLVATYATTMPSTIKTCEPGVTECFQTNSVG